MQSKIGLKLDNNFIKRATRVTAFNLNAADFTTSKYKKEIQHLYRQHMFGSFNPDDTLRTLDKRKYNQLIQVLKNDDKEQYDKLHNLQLKGVGPGEAVLYLLTRDGHLGGGSSAGVDLLVGSNKYEVKAVKWKSKVTKDYVSDFKLGGNIPGMTQLEADIQRAFYEMKFTATLGTPEIKGSLFIKFEKENPDDYAVLEKRYQNLAKAYFGSHDTVFIQTESNQPDFGEIISIQRVQGSDIKMERYTSRSIKPIIKVR
tara:strand:+ start:86 stop:856 length:771 start_codon:yes stop_codon:yes gene_type:complete